MDGTWEDAHSHAAWRNTWLNLKRLELEVYTDNVPAIRLYGKFGFTIEGTLVDFAVRDGQYVDVYLMARLRKV